MEGKCVRTRELMDTIDVQNSGLRGNETVIFFLNINSTRPWLLKGREGKESKDQSRRKEPVSSTRSVRIKVADG